MTLMVNQSLIVLWDRVRKQNKRCCCPILPLNTIVDYFSTSHSLNFTPKLGESGYGVLAYGSGKRTREWFEFGPVNGAD